MKTREFLVDTNTWVRACATQDMPYPNQANTIELQDIRRNGHPSLIRNEIMKRLANRQRILFTQTLVDELRRLAEVQDPNKPYTEPPKKPLPIEEKNRVVSLLGLIGQIIKADPSCLVPGIAAREEMAEHERLIKNARSAAQTTPAEAGSEIGKFQRKLLENTFLCNLPEQNERNRAKSHEAIDSLRQQMKTTEESLIRLSALCVQERLGTLEGAEKSELEKLRKSAPEMIKRLRRLGHECKEEVWADLESIQVAKAHDADLVSGDIDCKILGVITNTPVAHVQTNPEINNNFKAAFSGLNSFMASYIEKKRLEADGFSGKERMSVRLPQDQERATAAVEAHRKAGRETKTVQWGGSKNIEIFTKEPEGP